MTPAIIVPHMVVFWLLGAILSQSVSGQSSNSTSLAPGSGDHGGDGVNLVKVLRGENYSCAETCGFLGGLCARSLAAKLCKSSQEGPAVCLCDTGPGALMPPLQVSPGVASGESLLRSSPFLMTHDSATGYIGDHDPTKPFAKTQYLDLVGQLDCGVRAFDLRVVAEFEDFRQVHFHHGSGMLSWVSADQTLANTMPAIIEWSQAHPDELILFVVSHCFTRNWARQWNQISCSDSRLVGAFTDLGIKVETSCNALDSMTLSQASQSATMGHGGKMLMIPGEGGCVQAHYDDSIKSKDKVRPYVESTMAAAHSQGKLFQVQSFIQQSSTVPLSAELNSEIYSWLTTSQLYQGVNLLEINLACGYGMSIASVLGADTSGDADRCKQHCKTACEKQGACKQMTVTWV